MIKLLNANFTRLRKNKLFLVLTLFSIGIALLVVYAQYSNMKKTGTIVEIETVMLNYSTMIGVVIAIFTSLFLGVEYSDGAIRNKISIGHKRINIYLSNFITIIITSLFSYILYLIITTSIGIPLFGGITIGFSKLLIILGCVFMAIMSYASVFTFITMIISHKAISSIVNIVLAFGLMFCALTFLNFLSMPEYLPEYQLESGEIIKEETKNPYYLTGVKRDIIQLSVDINPVGQMYQIFEEVNGGKINKFPLYSLGVVVLFTGAGLLVFRKKELK